MIEEFINGMKYKLPGSLNEFQKKMYVHLIDWKWKHITKEVGKYHKKVNGIDVTYEYDAILPESMHKNYPLVYDSVLSDLKQHQKHYYFKLHQHFNHMASSQAANINLFLPILLHAKVNDVLKQLKPDFQRLATEYLYKGFRIEFWDGKSKNEKGLLGDHSAGSGTDSDIAIVYYNKENELCLWLIEHKLTEKEFTECGGYKSKGRDKSKNLCKKSFNEILKNKNLCYYHDVKIFNYWKLTDTHKSFFVNHGKYSSCPFKGGMNQLWRNQLLGLALENAGIYKHVYFSVVRHPENSALDQTICEYRTLTNNNPKFFDFHSKKVVDTVQSINNNELNKWVDWYKYLYNI